MNREIETKGLKTKLAGKEQEISKLEVKLAASLADKV